MKLNQENRYSIKPDRGNGKTEQVEVLELSNYQLGFMRVPESVQPGLYAVEKNREGDLCGLTPMILETDTERELFRNNKPQFEADVLKKLRK